MPGDALTDEEMFGGTDELTDEQMGLVDDGLTDEEMLSGAPVPPRVDTSFDAEQGGQAIVGGEVVEQTAAELRAPAPVIAEPQAQFVDDPEEARRAAEYKRRTGLSDPNEETRLTVRREQFEHEETIRRAFKDAMQPGVSPEQADGIIANHFEVPLPLVQQNREGWLKAYAVANNNPKKFIADNPTTARALFDHPENADVVVNSRTLNLAARKFDEVINVFQDIWQKSLEGSPEKVAAEQARAREFAMPGTEDEAAASVTPLTPEQLAEREQERAKKAAPTERAERDDAKAKKIRDEGAAAIIEQRGEEGRLQLEVSKKWSEIFWARRRGRDTSYLEAQLRDAEAKAMPLALGETGTTQFLGETWGTTQSTLAGLGTMLERASAGVAVGIIVGAVAGGLSTRTAAGVLSGARTGGLLIGRLMAAEGGFESAFVFELGDSYPSLLREKTDAGQYLTEEEAAGGALIAATLKAGIEVVQLDNVLKSMGPAGLAIRDGSLKAVREAMANNPSFRRMALNALKAAGGEGAEEVSQGFVDNITRFVTKSLKDGKMQAGPVVDVEEAKQNLAGSIGPALLMGGTSLVVSTATSNILKERRARAAMAAVALAELPSDPDAVAVAPALAKAIIERSQEAGDEYRAAFVDAEAFRRLYQTKEQAVEAIVDLMGPEGPKALARATLTKGKIEVPLEVYLARWGKGDVAKKLAKHTSTSASKPTQSEAEKQQMANEAWAKSIAEKHRKPGISATLDRFDLMQEQLQSLKDQGVDVGEAGGISDAIEMFRGVFHSMASKLGEQSVEQVFRNVLVYIDDGIAALPKPKPLPVAEEFLVEELAGAKPLTPEQRAERALIDENTGLNTFESFVEQQKAAPSKSVWSITLTDIKPINDAELGGHDTANALLRHVSPAAAAVDPNAGIKGTNFVGAGGEAEMNRALEGVRALLPEGMSAEGGFGATVEEALSAMDANVDKLRAEKKLPERGTTAADLTKLPEMEKGFLREVKHRVKLTKEQLARIAAMPLKDFFRSTYFDRDVPTVLSGIGWRSIPRKAFVASMDIKGLKDVNALGKDVGDAVLKLFAETAARIGGQDFDFAHLSGDEYAAQHQSKEALEKWLGELEAALAEAGLRVPVTFRTADGTVVTKRIAAQFRSGVGEKTYGAADRVLNANKRAEKQRLAEEAARAASERAVAARGRGDGAARGEVQPGDEGRGGEAGAAEREAGGQGEAGRVDQGPGRPVGPGVTLRRPGEAADTSFDFGANVDEQAEALANAAKALIAERAARGPLRSEEALAIRQGFNSAANIAEVRAAAERMTKPENKLALTAFLDWVENKGPGIIPEGSVFARKGAIGVTEQTYKAVLKAAGDAQVIDPQTGISGILASDKPTVEKGLQRAKKKGQNARNAYERAVKADQRAAFNRNVLGRLGQTERQKLVVRDEAIEAKLDQEGRSYSVFVDEDGTTGYWSWSNDGTVRVDFSEQQMEAHLSDDADAARWRDTEDSGIDGATLRALRAASAPSLPTISLIRRETGAPIRSDGTISAAETVVVRRLYSTRKAADWVEMFRKHKAVVDNYSPQEVDDFVSALMAHRGLVQKGIDDDLLPPESESVSPLRSNPEFNGTFDISTICPRQDVFTATIKAVERKLNRLLEPMQRHLVGLMLRDVGAQPACWYCYGQAGRNAYDFVIGQSRDKTMQVIELYQAASKSGKKVTGEQFKAIFKNKEAGTKWDHEGKLALWLKKNWLRLAKEGVPNEVRLRDLARREVEPESDLEREYAKVVKDFVQAATKANDPKGWATLRSQLLDTRTMPQPRVDRLNARAGLRMNSQTDFRPWHVIEVWEAIASMKARGLKAHVYTKESGFLRAFGRTGIKFNLSAFYKRNGDGSIQKDASGRPVLDDVIGMSSEEVEHWNKTLPNDAGGMLVAHNDEALLLGLADERMHMIIPYHAGPIAREKGIGKAENARDYSEFQHEDGWKREKTPIKGRPGKFRTMVWVEGHGWVRPGARVKVEVDGEEIEIRAGKDLDASTHRSKQTLYLKLCKHLGLKPKFFDLKLTRPDGTVVPVFDEKGVPIAGYMKMVRDVARNPEKHNVPTPALVDRDAATDIETKWVESGGDKAAVEPDARVVNHVLGRIERNQWPEPGKIHTQEEIEQVNKRVYGKQGGGTLAKKWTPADDERRLREMGPIDQSVGQADLTAQGGFNRTPLTREQVIAREQAKRFKQTMSTRGELERRGLPAEPEEAGGAEWAIEEAWLLDGVGSRSLGPSTYLINDNERWEILRRTRNEEFDDFDRLSPSFDSRSEALDWYVADKKKAVDFQKLVKDTKERLEAEKVLWSDIAQKMSGKGVEFSDKHGDRILLTPARKGVGGAREGDNWRVTWFVGDQPSGHTFAGTHAEAVESAKHRGARPDTARSSDEFVSEREPLVGPPAFSRWFGESKVVDENGHPLRMFHGTNNSFDVFKNNFHKGSRRGIHNEGLWFTSSPDHAAKYGEGALGANIMPVYLSIQNPARRGADWLIDDTIEGLRAEGYDGVYVVDMGAWVAFDSSQVKSATGNRGTYNRASPNILFQEAEEATPNGWTDFTREGVDRLFRIALPKGQANKTTFLHESAHVFLELFADYAARADAPASVKADWETTLDWLGVDSYEELHATVREDGTPLHEKWAEAFELYLATGKFPARRLVGPMTRFRLWMGEVYRGITMKSQGALSPEITGVFDRLLATDDEIADMKERAGLKAIPREALGMAPEEYQEHLEQLQKATSHAQLAGDLAIAKDMLRVTEQWWKDARKKFVEEADAAYEKLSARRAQKALDGEIAGVVPAAPIVLDKDVVEGWLGAGKTGGFKLKKDGLHPDEVVETYPELGFSVGREMVEAIRALPAKEDFVEGMADKMMADTYPGVLDDREKLRARVAEGLHGKATMDWALKEWASLHARAPKGTPTMPSLNTLRLAARLLVNGMTAGEMHVSATLAAERKAADAAQVAAIKGDYAQAAAFKQEQVLQMLVHAELLEAKKVVEELQSMGTDLKKLKARKKLGQADKVYRESVDLLLAKLGFSDFRQDSVRDIGDVLREVEDALTKDGITIGFDRERLVDRMKVPASREVWRSMMLEDLKHALAALKNIEAGARSRTTTKKGEALVAKETAKAELIGEAEKSRKLPHLPTWAAANLREKAVISWTAFDGALLKIETMARWLSGAKDTDEFIKTAWYQYIIEPMQKAKALELDLAAKHLGPLVAKWDSMPESMRSRGMELIDSDALFPQHIEERKPRRRFEIIIMLLNSGNAGNLARLTEGRNISEQELRDAAKAVGVTREEYEWIQEVWDTAESLKPLAFDLEESDSGVRPEEVIARPFVNEHGDVMRGGYFPAVYDRITQVGRAQETSELIDHTHTRPGTTNSSLKKRSEGFSDIISLDPSSIQRHFAQTIHDVAFRLAVRSVGNLFLDEDIKKMLRERIGEYRADAFINWVKDIAQMRGADSGSGMRWFERVAQTVRSNIVVAVLGYKIPNALEDFTSGLASAITASDLRAGSLQAALYEVTMSPKESWAFVQSKSGEVRARRNTMQRDLAKQIRSLSEGRVTRWLNTGFVGLAKDKAFAFAEAADRGVVQPVWLGAYRQYINDHQGDAVDVSAELDAEAVAFADATLRQVQPSHNTVDLSALMRNKGPLGYILMFGGAWNHFYNQYRNLARTNPGEAAGMIAKRGVRLLGYSTGLFILGSIARGQGPDKDEPLPEWLIRKTLFEGFMQLTPLTAPIGAGAAKAMRDKPATLRNNTLMGVIEGAVDSLILAANSDADPKQRIGAAINPLGPALGYPIAGPKQILTPVIEWGLDDNEWRNPLDAASDVVYGKRKEQPWNPIMGVSDFLEGEPRR